MLVHAVDYAPDGAVDYGPFGPVDYDAPHLWISQPCGLGAYIHTCGAVGVVGSGDDCLSLAYLRCSP